MGYCVASMNFAENRNMGLFSFGHSLVSFRHGLATRPPPLTSYLISSCHCKFGCLRWNSSPLCFIVKKPYQTGDNFIQLFWLFLVQSILLSFVYALKRLRLLLSKAHFCYKNSRCTKIQRERESDLLLLKMLGRKFSMKPRSTIEIAGRTSGFLSARLFIQTYHYQFNFNFLVL